MKDAPSSLSRMVSSSSDNNTADSDSNPKIIKKSNKAATINSVGSASTNLKHSTYHHISTNNGAVTNTSRTTGGDVAVPKNVVVDKKFIINNAAVRYRGVESTDTGTRNNRAGMTKAGEEQNYHSLSMAYQTYLNHDQKEQNHWEDVCKSYRQYATFAMAQWANHQYRLHSLPEVQRKVLPRALRIDTEDFHKRSTLYKEAAIRNQFCLDCILRHAGMPHSQQILHPSLNNNSELASVVSDNHVSKVSSVLKSLARDWSIEGKPEREMASRPIIRQVHTYLPIKNENSDDPPKICVPGAGVGRLALELTSLGYAVQGNDFSLHMLLASDFILNGGMATPENPLKISPWLLESRNVHSPIDPLRIVQIPDIDPYSFLQKKNVNLNNCTDDKSSGNASSNSSNLKSCNNNDSVSNINVSSANTKVGASVRGDDASRSSNACGQQQHTTDDAAESMAPPNFSMAAGEFGSIYGHPREQGNWDAVVCAFFLDTSPSIVEYIQIIHGMLKPGGLLISFGPLLYHWSGPAMRPDDKTVAQYHERYKFLDPRFLNSIDLCWEDIRVIIYNIGFDLIEEKSGLQTLYTADRRSMMNMNYRCLSFVARKRALTMNNGFPSSASTVVPTTSHHHHFADNRTKGSIPSANTNDPNRNNLAIPHITQVKKSNFGNKNSTPGKHHNDGMFDPANTRA